MIGSSTRVRKDAVGASHMLPFAPRGCMQFSMHSAEGSEYRIFISKPDRPASGKGYGVAYFLDGNAVFGLAAEALRLQTFRQSEIEPTVLVGIGYPTDAPYDIRRRTLDLTPAAAARATLPRPDGSDWPPSGGAEKFFGFIEDELKAVIEAEFPIDRERQAIFGHSFGGLFVLHILFTHPEAFQTYIAASPSVWWKDCAIIESEQAFAAEGSRKTRGRQLLITAGSREQDPGASPYGAERGEWVRKARMVENAEEMVGRLSRLPAENVRVDFMKFDGENHISVIPAAISRAVGLIAG